MTAHPGDPTLTRGGGATLWRQIADVLAREVRDGAFDATGKLPSERELTDRFGVNRHTVRRALAAVCEEGIVRAEQGRGVFVNKEMVDYPLGRRVRFTETLTAQQRSPEGRILDIVSEKASEEVAAALEVRKGVGVWRIERLAASDETPLAVASHYFAKGRFPRLGGAFEDNGSITRALAANGVADYERRSTAIVARPATAEECRLLDLPRGRPVLVTQGVNVDDTGAVVEYSVARFAADRVRLSA